MVTLTLPLMSTLCVQLIRKDWITTDTKNIATIEYPKRTYL